MRILLVTPYFPPQQSVASLRTYAFAKYWSAAGEQVTVLTTEKQPDQREWPKPCDGFEVVEIPYTVPALLARARKATRPAKESGAQTPKVKRRSLVRWARETRGVFASVRMPDLTDRWIKPAVAWAQRNGPWDVVYSSAGPYTAHLAARAIRGADRASHWVAEFRDLWTDNPIHRGLFPFTVRERALEGRCLDEADLLVTVSEPLADTLRRKTDTPVIVAYNGHEPDELETLDPKPVFPNDGLVRIVFTGSIYPPSQDPGPFLCALAKHDNLRLVVAGASENKWSHLAKAAGATNRLELHGLVDRETARRMQRDAHALLLVDFEGDAEGAMTTKAFEYLSVTAPILVVGGTGRTPLAELIKTMGRGVAPGSDNGALEVLVADLDAGRSIAMTKSDRALIETLTRRHQSMEVLEEVGILTTPAARV